MFKVIVAGTRHFEDYSLLEEKLDYYLSDKLPNVEIVSGTAKGADQLGERYATERNLPVKKFPANWYPNGKGDRLSKGAYEGLDRSAGPKRNADMAKYADALILFWDGKSSGAKSMLGLAERYNVVTRVIRY